MLIEGNVPFLSGERVKYNSAQYGCGIGYVIKYIAATDTLILRGDGGTPWLIQVKSTQAEKY